MNVELPRDPRFREVFETEAHDYRVVFWRHQRPPAGHSQEEMGFAELTYDVSKAQDVLEVVAWAEEQAEIEGSTYCVYVRLPAEVMEEAGLVQIAGVNPTSSRTGFVRHLPQSSTTGSPSQ